VTVDDRIDPLERVAKVVHEADRAWAEAMGELPPGHWEDLSAQRHERTLGLVRLALAGAPLERLHVALADARGLAETAGYEQVSEDEQRRVALAVAIATALGCGVERWAVKCLTDADAAKVSLTPVPSTIAELGALPSTMPTARTAEEFTTYMVSGTITMAKLEADSDVHMVLDDGVGHTMIVEAVCPGCASGSLVAGQIADVRALVAAKFPTAVAGGIEQVSVPVTVTGIAFYDRLHGQTGVAPNGIELHPLIGFEVTP
jgi:hypothetical protein